ncbi:sensor histidine kinase [Nocardioides mangrovi]|uniref:histidine kinase n=1 Tax=Nocardioides mangrovi TaxID=2874580 RepID=A0ABS7U8I0_9ACTN|nr:HAMP domain-containing sensor histidine kinase [Nocardioides mangrovi]MBZ5737190.1 HAMP domain-containing histidine kinase [Nocardioides mangrovi]
MQEQPPSRPGDPDRAGWSDSSARAVLQLMAESVGEMIGFEYSVLSVVMGDQLVTVAYYGPEEHREYLSRPDPVSLIEPIMARAEEWGPRLRYLPAGTTQDLEGHWVRFEQDEAVGPDGWNPMDALLAILRDDAGEVIGIISVDKPVTGRLPDARQRSLFERYAAQAERAVLTTIEREQMVEQIAHAEAARRMIRMASRPAHVSLDAVLEHTHRPLVDGFQAGGSWLQVLDPRGVAYARKGSGDMIVLSDEAVEVAHTLAPVLWAEQRAMIVEVGVSPEIPESVHRELEAMEVDTALAVALGAGPECIGFLALSRFVGDPPWSAVEIDSAIQIGHDLGAALMTARSLERERLAVSELQQLDDYRSHLVATLSHELRTPLTVIAGNLELLGALDLDPTVASHHQAMTRGAVRMQKVVDDLLLLARVSDPGHPLERIAVDVRDVVTDVASLVDSAAEVKGVRLGVDLPAEPLTVAGDPTEIDRLVGNLVSNAVKYTPTGGGVHISADRHGDHVVLRVADDGLGISEEDQRGLFKAFFRTTNPDALREQGTGLGLTIVASIVERHDGKVDVASRLGEGTTFTVTLPAA